MLFNPWIRYFLLKKILINPEFDISVFSMNSNLISLFFKSDLRSKFLSNIFFWIIKKKFDETSPCFDLEL